MSASASPRQSLRAFYWRMVLRPQLWLILAVFGLMLGVALLEMVTVALGVPLLDVAMKAERASGSRVVAGIASCLSRLGVAPATGTILFTLLILVCVMAIIRGGLFLLQQYGTTMIAQKFRIEIKSAMLEKVLGADYAHLTAQGRGKLLYDLNTPPLTIHIFILLAGTFLSSLCNAILLVGLMWYLSWWATLALGLGAFCWTRLWRGNINQRSAACSRELYDLNTKQNQIDVDTIDGLKIVKAHNLSSTIDERQMSLLSREFAPRTRLVWFKHGANWLNETGAVVVIMGLAAMTLDGRWVSMAFSELIVFLAALRRLIPVLATINTARVSLYAERKNLEVVRDTLQVMPSEARGWGSVPVIQEIRFAELSFQYESGNGVLDQVSLAMRRGEITAIVGSTGSGKSTLANLLLGLYHPTSGQILVNGADLATLDLAAWRSKIGYVPQDVFLFNDTIRNNIAVWDERVSQGQIERAAQMSQLHEFILTLSDGYATVVGDRGLRLSGGQCQRLAIARAILHRPEVLIFDEATSALDTLTEKAVYEAIHAMRAHALVIVIAHRISTVKESDQIVVLRDGRIAEQGTHQTLIDAQGVYASLHV